MARKLYIFGIGGTGSRVIKSLTMLLASGIKLDNNFDTVVPIIIDPDIANGDLNRTKDILRLYQETRNQIDRPDDFFYQEIKTVNELSGNAINTNPDYFQFKLDAVDNSTFGQYIGYNTLSSDFSKNEDDRSFVNLLYSQSNLNSDLSIGFKGNPNMGSIVLNQFTNSQDFRLFAETFGPDDAVFIVNSIFGGTGAAGFPLLLKNLRGNTNLPHYAQIKDAPIGGLTYLPYFSLNQNGEINADSFEGKAKIAIDYYNRTIISQNKINVLHFIGNRGNTNIESYAVGGSGQRNKAHFLEVAGAMAIVEFCRDINNYSTNNGICTPSTVIKEFGIEHDNPVISFDDLNLGNKNLIQKPLSKFRLYTQYFEDNEGFHNAINKARWTKSNIKLVGKKRQSPCDEEYFKSAEYKNQVSAFNQHYTEWIKELSDNKPSFHPFDQKISANLYKRLDTQNCLLIDDQKLRSGINKESSKANKTHTTLIKLFGRSTERISNKIPLKVNPSTTVSKVFRLHDGQAGTGWFASAPIQQNQLDTIKTDGRQVATSIPSPFARIDLVKSAFAWVNNQVSKIVGAIHPGQPIPIAELRQIFEGDTAQNKLISDAFDVAQLFFKYQTINDKIEIVAWNPTERLAHLIQNSSDQAHKTFAETLKLYWDQDSISAFHPGAVPVLYNFEHVNNLFFVINKGTKQIIGGTSPATLFFAAPDANSAIDGLNIVAGPDKLLDNTYYPLYNREVSFIEYIYAVSRQFGFANLFPEVNTYLNNIQNYLLNNTMRAVVANLTIDSINSYNHSTVSHDKAFLCEVCGIKLGYEESYLTDKIIELPYTIDSSKFKTCGAKKHILPVTHAFIRQYGVENIEQYCKIEERAGGGVQATLNIPVLNGVLQYSRLYHRNDIIKVEFHLAVIPFIASSSINLDYTIGILDKRFDRRQLLTASYFKMGEQVEIKNEVVRKSGDNNTIKSSYYRTSSFDAIEVKVGNIEGFIIPSFYKSLENTQVSFAVDFGTTNTHIEYKKGAQAETPIDIFNDHPMWQSLIDRKSGETREIADDNNYEREILPYVFNMGSEYRFPFRTAVAYNKGLDFSREIEVFTHTNNFLLFEKLFHANYLEIQSKLKWSNYNEAKDKALVVSYIEGLLYMLLYKTLLLDGNPSEAKITWFYPVSMDGYEQGIFMDTWQNSYKKIFKVSNTANVNAIPESVAPYLFYRGTQYAGTCLSIDIGGGSSDIAFFEHANNFPEFISSVKFAGNSIFGDGFPAGAFSNTSDNNGYVNSFRAKAESIISKGSQKEIILNDILQKRKDSSDFSSFLFSLENERDVKFNYSEELRDSRKLKLPILVFYGGLFYYASYLIKLQNGSVPKNVLFSGTASKTLKILDSQQNYPSVSSLFKFILSNVAGKSVGTLKIALADNPKEITCKGVLRAGIFKDDGNCPVLYWLGGKDETVWGRVINKNENISEVPFYSAIQDDVNKTIVENSIDDFFKLLDRYVDENNLESNYGIDYSAYEVFRSIRSLHIKDYLDQGVKAFFKKPGMHIEETLFFYPLIGILHTLALELSNMDKQ